jgi:Na+/melibiose symporter-like transporter
MGDVVTPASRLRFFARRERRLLLGKIVGLLGVGVFTYLQRSPRFASELLAADAWRVALPLLGVIFLIASAFPLFRAPEICVERSSNASVFSILRQTFAPFRSPSFLALALFGVALQTVLGFTQAPQYYFRTSAFELSLFASLTATAFINAGQWSTASFAARFVARLRPATACFSALSVIAFGFLVYAFAPSSAWPLAFVAAIFWIAWVCVNIALNNEITIRSEPSERSAFVAFYFTSTALAFGLSSMLGGWNFDRVRAFSAETPTSDLEIVYCRCVFLIAAALLALAPATLLLFRGAANPNKNND